MKSNLLDLSRGVLLFALNTNNVNYVKIADLNAQCISKYLKLPITLITDNESNPKFNYHQVIRVEQTQSNIRFLKNTGIVEWKNVDRYLAYKLTPYDETLVLDCDYFMFNNSILKLFNLKYDYKIAYDMITLDGTISYNLMGPNALPQVWATAFIFKKTEKTKSFFNLIERIQLNYNYYRVLFGIREQNFRNDFAFSMANIILNGYTIDPTINFPWAIFTIEDTLFKIELHKTFFVARLKNTAPILPIQNIHFMDKDYLQSDDFTYFIEKILNE